MARKYQSTARSSGYTILVVDDSPDILESSRRLLESEGHRVLTAVDGPSGLEVMEKERVQLLLVDYFMPGMTGEEVVRRVRERDQLVQIILATGYSGEKPARVMMRELDIQGYHDKSEGAERLLLWVDAALKAHRHVMAMEKHRTGLRYLLDITPELHRFQPVEELLQCLLWQIEGLLGAENSFLATFGTDVAVQTEETEGFVALLDQQETRGLKIRFGTGRYGGDGEAALDGHTSALIEEALRTRTIQLQEGASVVPLQFGNRAIGIIFLDRHRGHERDQELLEVFSYQAAAAIQNSLLYDMATTDPLTGVYLRGFAVLQLQQAIKRGSRRADPISLLMIDMDRFKAINDTYGHQAGDRALAAVGALLRETIRETDTVGRYGGDEFMVVLPETPPAGALIVANRILARVPGLVVHDGGNEIALQLSVGVATLQLDESAGEYVMDASAIQAASEGLIASADRGLYSAKGTGRAGERPAVSWRELLTDAVVVPMP